jgi:hypothetical protein
MANIGANHGRVLNKALKRFTTMLISEAREITGMTYEQLDEALSYEMGTCGRWARGTRAVQLSSIQVLEDKVAQLGKRKAHPISVCDAHPEDAGTIEEFMEMIIDEELRPGMNLRDRRDREFELVYADRWPTYAQLEDACLTYRWRWQWGLLWEQDRLTHPWTRKSLLIRKATPVSAVVKSLEQEAYIYLGGRDWQEVWQEYFLPSDKPRYYQNLGLNSSPKIREHE